MTEQGSRVAMEGGRGGKLASEEDDGGGVKYRGGPLHAQGLTLA